LTWKIKHKLPNNYRTLRPR